MIGEGFPAELSEDIAGLVLSTRRQADRISMWTKTSADEAMQKRIGCVAAPRGTGCDFFLGGGRGGLAGARPCLDRATGRGCRHCSRCSGCWAVCLSAGLLLVWSVAGACVFSWCPNLWFGSPSWVVVALC